MKEDKMSTRELDIYRDTPVRLLGYTNEVGEAFRAWVPRNVVRLSYVVSSAYVIADSADKGLKAYRAHPAGPVRNRAVQVRTIDCLIWQALASVIIPGITINRACFLVARILNSKTSWPLAKRKLVTTSIGLSLIPFIVKPIDRCVDRIMDSTIRKYYNVTR